jgi:hypothetical protein
MHLEEIRKDYQQYQRKMNGKKYNYQEDPVDKAKRELQERFITKTKVAAEKAERMEARKMEIFKRVMDQKKSKQNRLPTHKRKEHYEVISTSITDEEPTDPEPEPVSSTAPLDFNQLEVDAEPLQQAKARIPIPLVRAKPVRKTKEKPILFLKPFELDPPLLQFMDIAMDMTYSKPVRVINATSSPKYFKLLGCDREIDDFVTVSMTPSGSMCSGAECLLQVQFTPSPKFVANPSKEDTFIHFQSSCGTTFDLKLVFSAAKCVPIITQAGGTQLMPIDFLKPTRDLTAKKRDIIRGVPRYVFLSSPTHAKVDFEDCVIGGKKKIWINIQNQGSVETEFYVDVVQKAEFMPRKFQLTTTMLEEEESDEVFCEGPFVIRNAAGVLSAYGSKKIAIILQPHFNPDHAFEEPCPISINASFAIHFENNQVPIIVDCVASTRVLTLYPDRQMVDFKHCLPNRGYQDKILLWNKHKISRKFSINCGAFKSFVRGDSKVITIPNVGVVEFSPSAGFIQPNSSSVVWIKVKFAPNALEYLSNGDFSQVFTFAYVEQITELERFAPLTIKASLTSNKIIVTALDQSENLDFGKVSVFERKKMQVSIQNCCKFEQLVQYVPSTNFKLGSQAGDLSATSFAVPPLTAVSRLVWFEPKVGSNVSEDLVFLTTNNYKSVVRCKGKGYYPPAHFSQSQIIFPALPFGNDAIKQVLIEKEKRFKHELSYTFLDPILISISDGIKTYFNDQDFYLEENDFEMIQVNPKYALFTTHDKIPIEISANILAKHTSTRIVEQGSTRDKGVVDKVSPLTIPMDQKPVVATSFQKLLFSLHHPLLTWLIPCQLKALQTEEDRLKSLMAGEPRSELFGLSEPSLIYLQVCIPCRDAELVLLHPSNHQCSFQSIPVGVKKVQFISIMNISSRVVKLGIEGLSPHGPFSVSGTEKEIQPQAVCTIPVNFKPCDSINYSNLLVLGFEASRVKVRLMGAGLLPRLELNWSDKKTSSSSHLLDLGNVCVGDVVSREITITNPTTVPLLCKFSILGSHHKYADQVGIRNKSGSSPFYITCFRSTLAPLSTSGPLEIFYAPDCASSNSFDFLSIEYYGQEERDALILPLKARAWESSPCIPSFEEHPWTYKGRFKSRSQQEDYEWISSNLFPNQEEEGGGGGMGVALQASKGDHEFITIPIKWKSYLGSELGSEPRQYLLNPTSRYWRLEGEDFLLSNLKTNGKAERKSGPTEFLIEKVDIGFEYDVSNQSYVFSPPISNPSGFRLEMEPSRGVIESGSSKSISIQITHPTRVFLDECVKEWDRLDAPNPNPNPNPNNNNNIITTIDSSSKIATKYDGGRVAETMGVGIWPEKEAAYFREACLKMEEHHDDDVHVEQVFRVTFRNGMRFVEPKGTFGSDETRVFYCKVVAKKD